MTSVKSTSPKIASLTAALGLASAIAMMAVTPSYAQVIVNDDATAHVYSPRTNGQCWHPTDAAFSERGFGYWGACATPAATVHHVHARKHIQHHENH